MINPSKGRVFKTPAKKRVYEQVIPQRVLKPFALENTPKHTAATAKKVDDTWVAFENQLYLHDQNLLETFTYDTRYTNDRLTVVRLQNELRTSEATKMPCYMKGCLGVIKKENGVYYGHCSSYDCNAVNIFYTPTPIQEAFVNNDHDSILLSIGGYGSGKTTGSAAKVFRHMLFIPHANILAGAQTLGQVRQTGQVELIKFIPQEFFTQKTMSDWVLQNGSHIEWVATDKEDKIRGRNLSLAWLIEVNEIALSVVDQMIARIRSDNAIVYDLDNNGQKQFYVDKYGTSRVKTLHNYCQIILESNPDPNSETLRTYWVKARTFICTTSVKDPSDYIPLLEPVNEDTLKTCVYLTTGMDNAYLDAKNVNALANLSGDAYKIFVLCDLSMKEGIVYDKWPLALFPDIRWKIDERWPRIYAADFGGGHAPTAMIAGAIDPDTRVCYVYRVKQRVDSSVIAHVPWMHEMIHGSENATHAPWPVWAIVGDPSGKTLREGNTRTVFTQYAEYGIQFSPASNSKGNKIKDLNGFTITNDMIESGMLKILDIPEEEQQLLIKQLQTIAFKYEPAKGNKGSAKVLEKVEHTPYRDEFADCLRYLAVWLAHNKEIALHKPIVSINQNRQVGGTYVYNNGRIAVGVTNVKVKQSEKTGVRLRERRGQHDPRQKNYWK